MGGDHGLAVTVPAAVSCLRADPSLTVTLVGQEFLIQQQLNKSTNIPQDRLHVLDAEQLVSMGEAPASALKNKPRSSMRLAIDLVASKQANACLSAGNTGALLVNAYYVLKTLNGIERPAIATGVPTHSGECVLLDMGANVQCSAQQLHQFAIMGSNYAQFQFGIPSPKVALLNVGSEDNKGHNLIKVTAELLEADQGLNYVGFVEGNHLYDGEADVIVCDGFVGNVALKVGEGTARFIEQKLQATLESSVWRRLLGQLLKPALRQWQESIDPRFYNGACFLGLQGLVMKSHGAADIVAFSESIKATAQLVRDDFLTELSSCLRNSAERDYTQ